MNYTLTLCMLLSLLVTHVGYSSESTSQNKFTMFLSAKGMDKSVFKDVSNKLKEICNNHQVVGQSLSTAYQTKKPMDNNGIRVLMKNIELILELEDLVDKNQHKISRESKIAVINFTKQVKDDYKEVLINEKAAL